VNPRLKRVLFWLALLSWLFVPALFASIKVPPIYLRYDDQEVCARYQVEDGTLGWSCVPARTVSYWIMTR
jgi:hypothetical protein